MADEESGGAVSGAAQGALAGGMIGGPVGAVIGGALGGLGGALGGRAAKKARRRQEAIQREMQNLRIAQRKTQLAQEINAFGRKSEMAYGDTISSFAKAGVSLSDSPLLVLNDQRNEFDKTMNNIKETGAQEIRLLGMGMSAINAESRAARAASTNQMIGSLLSTAGSFAASRRGTE